MTKLILSGLHIGIYDDSQVNAYLIYGDKKSPLDHNGKKLGADREIPERFINHLNTVILPMLKITFAESVFVLGQAACEQGSLPFITITHIKNKDLDDANLNAIRNLIETSLAKFNAKKHPAKLFSGTSATADSSADKKYDEKAERKTAKAIV